MSANCEKKIRVKVSGNIVEMSCGRCKPCRWSKLQDLLGRAHAEWEAADYAVALTLTYADPEKPVGASKPLPEAERSYDQLRLLLMRLRKKAPIRHLSACEYGSKNGRFHIHLILWMYGDDLTKGVPRGEKAAYWADWPHGTTYVEDLRAESIGYVAKYVLKEVDLSDDTSKNPRGGKAPPAIRKVVTYAEIQERKNAKARLTQEEKDYFNDRQTKCRWSQRPLFGLGLSPDNAFRQLARNRVKQGLPFDRAYKLKSYTKTDGLSTVRKPLYMANQQLVKEAYKYHCEEYYKKTGKGDPPISTKSDEKLHGEKNQRTAVLNLVYGPKFRVLYDDNPWDQYPFPYNCPRTQKKARLHFEYARVYDGGKFTIVKLINGRFVAVQHVEPQKVNFRTEKGVITWPIRDVTELARVVRGRKAFRVQRFAKRAKASMS